jgi:hypothetical protein
LSQAAKVNNSYHIYQQVFMGKYQFYYCIIVPFFIVFWVAIALADVGDSGSFQFETDAVRYVISSNGQSKSLLQKDNGHEWLKSDNIPFAAVAVKGVMFPVSKLLIAGELIRAEFSGSGVIADFKITSSHECIVIQLVHIQGDGVEEVRLAQLRTSLGNIGPLVPAQWNDNFTVSLMGLSDRVHSRIDEKNQLVSSVYPEFGMEGEKIAVVAASTPKFYTAVQAVEHNFQLPSPKLKGQWAKLSSDIKESYLFTDLGEANVDETISYAKQAGFTYILIYSGTWSTSNGSYPINIVNFPRGEASLKAVIDKCHAAGIKVGMHMLTSFVGKNDPIAHPVPDAGLLKDAEAVLAENLDAKSQEIVSTSSLGDFPGQPSFYGNAKEGLDIQIDDEIIHYRAIRGSQDNAFVQCVRGFAGTRATQHQAGAKIFHLAERYGSYLANLRTPLREKISERVAGVINRCGFDMVFFDGGEVNSANGPSWYWVSQQQMDIWKRVERDLLVQGSGMTPWTWHIWGRETCDDFAAVATKEYLDFYKISYVMKIRAKNLIPSELGWWGFLDYAPHHPATSPDEVEYYAIRMLALDSPVSLETTLKSLRANGRTAEMLTMLGQYEKLRLQKNIPLSVLERLRSGEWHMCLNGERPEFRPVRYDVKRLEMPGEAVVQNEFAPQQLKFRLEATPSLSKVGDRSNIVLYEPDNKLILRPAETKTFMSGALVERIDYSKQADKQGSVFMVGAKSETGRAISGNALDLTTHRALAVRLKVEGPVPQSGEPCAVVNLQLESGGKTYRDHYIDLNFTGQRTIILPGPNTERMLREFWPSNANYSFKAAMYNFNYTNIVALNIRWMRQSVGKPVQCNIEVVEALTETDTIIQNPEFSIDSVKTKIPVLLTSGDYLEYWGEGEARVFDKNGVQLTTIKIPGLPILKKGENRIFLGSAGTSSAKLTTILQGDSLTSY